ncbi:MAG: hypothetical protein IT364_03235 [Candidatus Hydrogenedentes bacterium]|nr:hypothetical protein [Candidatus Hydrogenedentota bacterium]
MRPSSIFSFDTLLVRPRITGPAWAALGVFVAARLALLARPDAFLSVADLETQYQYLTVEGKHRLAENRSPEVIIAGTSRLGALSTECMAERLGCPPESIANYSRAGNSYWRILAFLKRNPEAMKNLRLLVIDLLPFQMYRGPILSETDPMFLALASPQELQRIASPWDKAVAFADRVVPYVSERRRVIGWWDAFGRLAMDERQRSQAALDTVLPAAQRGGTPETAESAPDEERMNAYAPGDVPSYIQQAALTELRGFLPQDTRLALVWLPVRDDFVETLLKPGSGYAELKTLVESKAPRAELVWVEHGSEWGMTQADFVDVVHFTPEGFDKVCAGMGAALAPLDRPAPIEAQSRNGSVSP